ncbi:MAG: hypothetical protein WD556_10950 [Actinomycetota bacterium]
MRKRSGRRAQSVRRVGAILCLAAVVVGVEATGAGAVAGCSPAWRIVPSASPERDGNLLLDVDASSSINAWAVGYQNSSNKQTLVERWTGQKWVKHPAPSPFEGSTPSAELHGVVAIGRDEGWAVGRKTTQDFRPRTLTMRWNGDAWKVLPSPHPSGAFSSSLHDVDASSSSDVWAVGSFNDDGRHQPLVLRRQGSDWVRLEGPPGSSPMILRRVEVIGHDDVWAVGTKGTEDAFAAHWNGNDWTSYQLSTGGGALNAVTQDVWGNVLVAGEIFRGPTGAEALVARFETGWVEDPADNPGSVASWFTGIDETVSTGGWAAGGISGGGTQDLVEVFDGSQWRPIATPGGKGNHDFDALVAAAGHVWAVGKQGGGASIAGHTCPATIGDDGFGPTGAIRVGEEAVWVNPASSVDDYGVVDASGLDLFDSGSIAPGGSFMEQFTAAGSYPIEDRAGAESTSLGVRMLVPAKAKEDRRFDLRWASVQAPAGLVYDVQVRRPGGVFNSLKDGASAPTGSYVPGTTGRYTFRARVRASVGADATGWSPQSEVRVT